MPIQYRDSEAVFVDVIAVDEAEALLTWLQEHPQSAVRLGDCTHLHAANLQVLMAAKTRIETWPEDTDFADLLKTALPFQDE
jgi:hypothetical protein